MLVNICEDAGFVLRIVVKLVKIIHIAIPVILILLIMFDLAKLLTGSVDDKAKRDAFSKAAQRVIYAVIIFFIPTIITLIFRKIEPMTSKDSQATSTSWISCWNYYYDK